MLYFKAKCRSLFRKLFILVSFSGQQIFNSCMARCHLGKLPNGILSSFNLFSCNSFNTSKLRQNTIEDWDPVDQKSTNIIEKWLLNENLEAILKERGVPLKELEETLGRSGVRKEGELSEM